MQEVTILGQNLEEISLNGLWGCGENRHAHAFSSPNTQKAKCKTPEVPERVVCSPRDQNKVKWLKRTHLQDTLNEKVSNLKHEQEGTKDNCSRSSNVICGSLPLNKKLITNNLWLTAAISLCLTLTDSNPINFYWSASGPSLSLFWTSVAGQWNALSMLHLHHSTPFPTAEY